jgi:hypothetical protein
VCGRLGQRRVGVRFAHLFFFLEPETSESAKVPPPPFCASSLAGHVRESMRRRLSHGRAVGRRVARWHKNPNLGKFWTALEWKMLIHPAVIWNILLPFGLFYGNLVNFVVVWCVMTHFGRVFRDKSGNPGRAHDLCLSSAALPVPGG